MRCETIPITVPGADGPASLAAYLPDNLPELGRDRRRPAVIVCCLLYTSPSPRDRG